MRSRPNFIKCSREAAYIYLGKPSGLFCGSLANYRPIARLTL